VVDLGKMNFVPHSVDYFDASIKKIHRFIEDEACKGNLQPLTEYDGDLPPEPPPDPDAADDDDTSGGGGGGGGGLEQTSSADMVKLDPDAPMTKLPCPPGRDAYTHANSLLQSSWTKTSDYKFIRLVEVGARTQTHACAQPVLVSPLLSVCLGPISAAPWHNAFPVALAWFFGQSIQDSTHVLQTAFRRGCLKSHAFKLPSCVASRIALQVLEISSPKLQLRYEAYKDAMPPDVVNGNEQLVFHGCANAAIDSIAATGFLRSFQTSAAGAWQRFGPGFYYALQASKSHEYPIAEMQVGRRRRRRTHKWTEICRGRF
jgi:hypothetical protein